MTLRYYSYSPWLTPIYPEAWEHIGNDKIVLYTNVKAVFDQKSYYIHHMFTFHGTDKDKARQMFVDGIVGYLDKQWTKWDVENLPTVPSTKTLREL